MNQNQRRESEKSQNLKNKLKLQRTRGEGINGSTSKLTEIIHWTQMMRTLHGGGKPLGSKAKRRGEL